MRNLAINKWSRKSYWIDRKFIVRNSNRSFLIVNFIIREDWLKIRIDLEREKHNGVNHIVNQWCNIEEKKCLK